MDKRKLYLSTIDPEAARIAQEYGIGLEIAEYCTAWNMDEEFAVIDPVVQKKLYLMLFCKFLLKYFPHQERNMHVYYL